jgi:hypothetical protein
MEGLTESQKNSSALGMFAGGGEMGALMRSQDRAHDGLSGHLRCLKYFQPTDVGYVFNAELRRCIIFASEDLGRFWAGLPFITKFVGLGSRLKQVLRYRRPTSLKNVECSTANGTVYLDVQIAPISDSSGSFLGVSLTFTSVTHSKQLSEELERSKWQLAEVSQKLESTLDELTKTKMELECLKQELEIMHKERQ